MRCRHGHTVFAEGVALEQAWQRAQAWQRGAIAGARHLHALPRAANLSKLRQHQRPGQVQVNVGLVCIRHVLLVCLKQQGVLEVRGNRGSCSV
jgi:hypothetical protein